MDLRDAFVIERYRQAAARQELMARAARTALTIYLLVLVVVVLAAGAVDAGGDSMDLDRHAMPDFFALLSWLVALAAVVALAQIAACVIRQGRARGIQHDLDADRPASRAGWWLGEAVYVAIIVMSAIAAWNTFATLGEVVFRQP